MRALIPLLRRSRAVWLAALLSPTAFCLLLMLGVRWFLPSPPDGLVAALVYLLPPVALLVCGTVVPWALGFGELRGIPLDWLLIDCAFGIVGSFPMWLCWRLANEVEAKSGS